MDNRLFDSGASVTPPTAPAAPSAGYPSNGDPLAPVLPTYPGAFWFHQVGESLRNIITRVGRTPNHLNLNLLADSIQDMIEARVGDFSIDTGTANAKVVALNPAITAYTGNFGGAFKNAVVNAGAAVTINFGAGPVPLVNDVGAALVAGDLPAGAVLGYQYIHADAKAYVTSLVTSQALTQARADTLYAPISGVAGDVLQKVVSTDNGSTTTSTTMANLNASTKNITPKSVNSDLLVTVQFEGEAGYVSAAATYAQFQLYDSTNAVLIGQPNKLQVSNTSFTPAANSTGQYTPCTISAIVPNSAQTARGFTLRGLTSNAGAVAGATKMVWAIEEVAK